MTPDRQTRPWSFERQGRTWTTQIEAQWCTACGEGVIEGDELKKADALIQQSLIDLPLPPQS